MSESSPADQTEHAPNDPRLNIPEAVAFLQAQQKYVEERSKRLRTEGLSQYIDLSRSDKFKHSQDDPWVDQYPAEQKAPALLDGSRCEFLVLGAGYGGLLFAIRLIQAGFNVDEIRIVDSASGYGGTWYWNRYPGLMCDVESYIYMPLLEEMGYMPKHKYAYGPELREYAEKIAARWELRSRTMFQTGVSTLDWDDGEREWVVKMGRADGEKPDITVRSRFVFVTSGLLNTPKLPGIPGIETFQGHTFHTSRWDYAYTGGTPEDPALANLKDKKVGILGTGATAIQAVPHLAKWAKELYVFQRTPSAVDRRDNHPTDREWWTREIEGKRGWQKERRENFNAFVCNASPPPPVDLVSDGWTKAPSFSALIGGPATVTPDSIPAHVASLHVLDLPRQERVRARVDEIVKDRATAQKLKPWYPSWCKRPCFHDDYLESFNFQNVQLVDTDGRGVDAVSEQGLRIGDAEYQLDLLIFSTGYSAPGVGSPAFRAGMSITGRDGRTLDQKWDEKVATLHGVTSRGFPNLFWPGPAQCGATPNQMFVLDELSRHVAYILSEAKRKASPGPKGQIRRFTIEPTAEAEENWSIQVLSRAATFAGMAGCTPGYLNREGEFDRPSGMDEQMKRARGAIWGKGIADFVQVIEGWRSEGILKGLEITAQA